MQFHPPGCFPQMYNVFPSILERLPGPHHNMFRYIDFLRNFVKTKIQEHKESLDPSSPRDFIDCFLIRMEQVGNNFLLCLPVPLICFLGGLKHPPLHTSIDFPGHLIMWNICINCVPSGEKSSYNWVPLWEFGLHCDESVSGWNWNHQHHHKICTWSSHQTPKHTG